MKEIEVANLSLKIVDLLMNQWLVLTSGNPDEFNMMTNEASLILECRKIYYQDIDPKGFLDPEIQSNYPNRDYHRVYFGEILGAFTQ